MKKLLSILGSLGLVATASAGVVACGTTTNTNDNKEVKALTLQNPEVLNVDPLENDQTVTLDYKINDNKIDWNSVEVSTDKTDLISNISTNVQNDHLMVKFSYAFTKDQPEIIKNQPVKLNLTFKLNTTEVFRDQDSQLVGNPDKLDFKGIQANHPIDNITGVSTPDLVLSLVNKNKFVDTVMWGAVQEDAKYYSKNYVGYNWTSSIDANQIQFVSSYGFKQSNKPASDLISIETGRQDVGSYLCINKGNYDAGQDVPANGKFLLSVPVTLQNNENGQTASVIIIVALTID